MRLFWKTKKKVWIKIFPVFIFLALPASTTYELKDFGFGSGGGSSTSTTYGMTAITGEQSGGKLTSTTYDLGSGMVFTNQANVPSAPSFTNPANYYNKLLVTLVAGENPSDAVYAIAISSDNFVTTQYVQSDSTVGATLGIEDYQTYTAWGGASGTLIIGLTANTTYKVKVKAMQGSKTETDYGPVATQATVGPKLSFDIDVSATDTETAAPFTTNLGNLSPGVVTNSPQRVWVDFDTNAENGGRVYIKGSNNGLASTRAGYTIGAVSGNLAALQEGFGVQGVSATQSAGGPFTLVPAYNLTSDNVAVSDTTIREIFTASTPVASGRGSFQLKAKATAVTPAASDYQEVLTVITSASF
jgi:hypothetical protein